MEVYDDPMTLFRDALANPLTRNRYERLLDQFFKFLELDGKTLDERGEKFVKKAKRNPKWVESSIMQWIRHQKERAERKEISTSSLGNYYKPFKVFCEMNDIILNWKKITRGIPKGKKHSTDRIPTLQEVKQLLGYPDRRIKPAVLTMLSSGIRLGAWDYLHWGDIIPIDKNGKIVAAKLIVYRGEPEEYFTFITPEAYYSIKEYLDFRKSHGEQISERTWVLRDEFDTAKSSRGLATVAKRLQSSGLKRLIERALWAQKLRKPLEDGQRRHEFKADHGFRKYFKTVGEKYMKSINVERLMGHSLGVTDSYYRISEEDLLNDYLKAVSGLSVFVSGANLDSEQVEELKKEMMRMKFGFVYVLQKAVRGKLRKEDVDKFLEGTEDIRFENERAIVKDNDGSDIVF